MDRRWGVGDTVWARVGRYGWRPAVVEFPGETRVWVPLIFESGKCSHGRRLPADLRRRDPGLHGRDKPTVAEAAAGGMK